MGSWLQTVAFLAVIAGTRVFHAGEQVDVQYGSTWYPATVLSVRPGQWEISYDGYGTNWNQLVGPDRIRPRAPASPPTPPAAPAPPPGHAIAHLRRVGAGTNVLVEWHGTWYPARMVTALDDANARIHYVGYGRDQDEDIGLDRVRLPDKP